MSWLFLWLGCGCSKEASTPSLAPRVHEARGVIQELRLAEKTIVIKHEAMADYMAAMTMPFHVQDATALTNLQPGDEITFRFLVTAEESWIEGIVKIGTRPLAPTAPPTVATTEPSLLDVPFTDQFGHPVLLNQFHGQAIAFTFFFTRCPTPEFCPRLMKNFSVASQKLLTLPNAPTNWHFFAITFDPAFDTPAVLNAYARQYEPDPRHWTFLTGPPEQVRQLAEASGIQFAADGSLFNHNFRTYVIDAAGALQMQFPISGNWSDALVAEIFKGAVAPHQPPAPAASR